MAQEISLSIEETNKLRAKIGLAPIPVQTNTSKQDNVIELSLEETNKLRISIGLKPIPIEIKQEQVIIKQKVELSPPKKQEKRVYEHEIHEDKTIFDEPTTSTDEWLENLGKKQLEQPKKRQKQVQLKQIQRKQAQQSDIDSINVKIGHLNKELHQLDNNDIFTMEDSEIINESEDILTNEKLLQQAKLKRDLAESKQAESIKFSGRKHISQESDSENEDDDNYLIQDKIVMTGSSISLSKKPNKKQPTISSLFQELDEASNKLTPIKMKKIKSKKKNQSKPRIVDEEIKPVELSNIDVNIEDDYEQDLQNALISTRRTKETRLNAEQLANEIVQSKRWQLENNHIEGDSFSRVYDETSEFLNNLDSSLLTEKTEEIKQEPEVKQEREVKGEPEIKQEPEVNQESLQTDQETPQFNGIAETLKFLQSKNIISEKSQQEKSQDIERNEATKQTELLKLRISIEERILRQELEKDNTYMRLPKVEKITRFEQELDERLSAKGIIIEDQHIRNGHRTSKRNSSNVKVENKLKLYNPKVELTYKDDSGNILNTKQAYKHLSHQYHGTGITKNKQDKLKTKVKEEPLEKSIIR